MQCLCAELKKCKDKDNGCNENGGEVELCDHSFCIVQRQKKDTKCVDIPPKGLPWASGYLKYLPGQRGYYKDLYLKDQAEQEAAKMVAAPCPCPPKKPKKNGCKKQSEAENPCLCFCPPSNGNGKKKGRKSGSRRSSDATSQMSSDKQNCCIEFEQVMVCDGTSSQPRKGFLVKPCRRPEAEMAISAVEDARAEGSGEGLEDKGMICLCIPRQYLQQWRGPEEDLCAKYGVKSECPSPPKANSKATIISTQKEEEKVEEEEAPEE